MIGFSNIVWEEGTTRRGHLKNLPMINNKLVEGVPRLTYRNNTCVKVQVDKRIDA